MIRARGAGDSSRNLKLLPPAPRAEILFLNLAT